MVIHLPDDADGKLTLVVYENYTKDVPDIYKTVDYSVNGNLTIDLNDIINDVGNFRVYLNYTGNYGDFQSDYYGYKVTVNNVDPVIVARTPAYCTLQKENSTQPSTVMTAKLLKALK